MERKTKTRAGHADARSRTSARKPGRRAASRRDGRVASRRAGRAGKRGSARAIVFGSVAVAIALTAALGVLALFMPELRLSRARSLVNAGQLDAADNLINVLESEGAPQNRIDSLRLALAEQHARAGNYAYASALAEDLPDGERRTEVIRACRYGQAEERYAAGDYEDAARRFYRLADYRDSAQRYADCRCALAVVAWLSGDEEGAEKALLSIEEAPERIEDVARHVACDEAEAARLLAQPLFNGAALARLRQDLARLSAARETVTAGRVAAGYRHTVGLRADGTVLAAGNDSFGQCDVAGWTDVIQVAAGAKHTLGLRADGTVLATGDDTYGQCDVAGWTDIAAVAANAYGSFGLKKDGTVLASSKYADAVSGWHGATAIAAGMYSAGCLYGQDGMLCTHPGGQLASAAGLRTLSVCGPVAAGIDGEGRLVSSYDRAPDWTDLAGMAVGENGFVGVTRDGRAMRFMFREGRSYELAVDGDAVEAAASGTHIVVMTSDGRAFAFGLNDQGQCDVSDWRL